LLDTAMLRWMSEFLPHGLLVTDDELNIRSCNKWFEKQRRKNEKDLINRHLLEAFPELKARGFDRYYRNALQGQSRVLSHRFHKYLLPMPPSTENGLFAQMQQSARIYPLFDGERVAGTITIIEDVTERVLRETELGAQIAERERLLALEQAARQLAEENSRLKNSNENLRLEGIELFESEQERGKLLHQIITTQEEERKRIARNIHDHLGQELTSLRLILSSVKGQCGNGADFQPHLEKAQDIAEKIDSEIDFLAWELRPAVFDDLGLVKALENFVAEWSEHSKIPAEFHSVGLKESRGFPDMEINLYRIAQEALHNILKHAKPNQVSVLLERQDQSIVLIIEDDGVGFEPDEKERANRNNRGMGLPSMKERALLCGGTLEIESAPNMGTTIYARIPFQLNNGEETKESQCL
jgi:PAS domain S-box-containing protein